MKTEERPIVEMDEVWSFAGSKKHKIWIRSAIDRYTRQIAGTAFILSKQNFFWKIRKQFRLLNFTRIIENNDLTLAVDYPDFFRSFGKI